MTDLYLDVQQITVEENVRLRHKSGSPDRQLRRRHSSAEDKRTRKDQDFTRRSWCHLPLRDDRICVYKVKSTGCIPRKDPSAPVDVTSPLAAERVTELKWDHPDSGPMRLGENLCSGETSSTTNRKHKMAKSFHTLIGRDKQLTVEEIPNIAVIGSGGGVRAMVSLSSVFCALHKENLLQYILYAAGLSGSSWYLTTLYSHPNWPKFSPDVIHEDIKRRVLDGLLNQTFDLVRASGTWMSELVVRRRPMNFTELFGLFLASRLVPDRYEVRWSDQKNKVVSGDVPFPLLACIHAKSDTSAKAYHEWVELSPFEVAIPKYGVCIEASYFGSHFESGKLINKLEELPLYYLNGICGSAFTILEEELNNRRKSYQDAVDSAIQNEQKDIDEQIINVKMVKCPTSSKNDVSSVDASLVITSSDVVQVDAKMKASTTAKREHVSRVSQKESLSNGVCGSEPAGWDVPEEKWDIPGRQQDQPDDLDVLIKDTVEGSLTKDEKVRTVTHEIEVERQTIGHRPAIFTGDDFESELLEEGGIPFLLNGDDFDEASTSDGHVASDDTRDDVVFDEFERLRRVRDECPGWLKDFVTEALKDSENRQIQNGGEDEVDGIITDGFTYVKNLIKRTVMERRDFLGRAAKLYNPLRRLSFEELSLSLKAIPGEIFSRIFEKAEDEELLCFIDAGLAFNSPYPVVLRHQRSIDLILSFDFTDRNEVDGDPFEEVRFAEKWARLHRVKFPPVPKLAPGEEVKELYILEDEDDPWCPTIMHFVLVNKQFKKFSKPGVPRKTEDEKKFADFDLFKDESCPYDSQRFQYTELEFDRLSKLMEFIVLNNRQVIIEQIKKATERKHCCKTHTKK